MNAEPAWIKVDESRYENEDRREVRSVAVHVSVSPYDVPHEVRGEFNQKQNCFVIEFRYLADEPTHTVRLADHANAAVGKKSGRIYSIVLDVESMNVKAVELKVQADNAFTKLGNAVAPKAEKNYDLARKVLGDYWASIAQMARAPEAAVHA